MSRKISLVLVCLFFTVSVFAQQDVFELDMKIPVFKPVTYFALAADEEENEVVQGIRNNEFYLESLRLTKLALETYEYGDYDASSGFAEEAIRYAQLSDEYVASQLIKETERLLAWADSNNIARRNANYYNESRIYYETSMAAYSNEEWTESIDASTKAIGILSALQSGGTVPTTASGSALPSQYTVRTWASVRDCLWNIAGYSWVYGEPRRWKELYEANKSKLPQPNNPDLIEPGMVLDIPSIRGETRQGMWDSSKSYPRQ